MITKLWERLGEGFAEKWLLTVFSPAFIFWLGGLFAYSAYSRSDFAQIQKTFSSLSFLEQVAWLVLGFTLVSFSATIVNKFQDHVAQLLEGYWPSPLSRLRFFFAGKWNKRIERAVIERQILHNAITAVDIAKKRQLDAELVRYPVKPQNIMPTLFGNILRAAEEYPSNRYGLDATVCWPRIYLLIPEETRKELVLARQKINENVRLIVWGVLFLIWIYWIPWAVISLFVIWISYNGLLIAGAIYCDLVRAIFDLYRFELYQALAWPLPPEPATEEFHGKQLTEYLFRGMVPENIEFSEKRNED